MTSEIPEHWLHFTEHVCTCLLFAGFLWLIPWQKSAVYLFRHPVRFRGLLYAVPLFLAPFTEKLPDILFRNEWPTSQQLAGCALMGTVTLCVGLRAYYDGSAERAAQKLSADEAEK